MLARRSVLLSIHIQMLRSVDTALILYTLEGPSSRSLSRQDKASASRSYCRPCLENTIYLSSQADQHIRLIVNAASCGH